MQPYRHVVQIVMEETLSQIDFIGLGFCFIEFKNK